MFQRRCGIAACCALLMASCSSRPREFIAVLEPPPADIVKYTADHEACRTLVAQGVRSGFASRMASGGVGVAAGVGAGAAAFGGTAGSMAAAAGAASAAMVMMPVVGLAAAWGLAKAQKAKKERELKGAMRQCLLEQGYTVTDWQVTKRRKKAPAA